MCRLWVPPRRTRTHPRTKPIFFSRVGCCFAFPLSDFLAFYLQAFPPSAVRRTSAVRHSTKFRYNGFSRVFTALRSFAPKTNLNIAYQHMRGYPRPTKLAPNKLPKYTALHIACLLRLYKFCQNNV